MPYWAVFNIYFMSEGMDKPLKRDYEIIILYGAPIQLILSYNRSNPLLRGNCRQAFVVPTEIHLSPNCDFINIGARTE